MLAEGRGACSTKHALVAALAAEITAPVRLVLGIYLMDGRNTPGVGEALDAAGLAAVPEAHCCLEAGGERLNLTWPGRLEAPPAFMWDEAIRPDQIGATKVALHRASVAAWAAEQGLEAARAWAAREACIAALSGA